MYFIYPMCCICLSTTEELKQLNLSNSQPKYYLQITAHVTEKKYENLKNYNLICTKCNKKLKKVHKFLEKCINNRIVLNKYLMLLHCEGVLEGKLNIFINDSSPDETTYFERHVIQKENNQILKFKFKKADFSNTIPCIFLKDDEEQLEVEQECMQDPLESQEDENIEIEIDPLTIIGDVTDDYECLDNQYVVQKAAGFQDTDYGNNADIVEIQDESILSDGQSLKSILRQRLTGPPTYNVDFVDDLNEEDSIPGQSDLKCSICPKEFSRQSSLDTHMLTHTGTLFCKFCTKQFNSRSTLQRHVRKTHKDAKALTIHKPETAQNKDDKYVCKLCEKACATPIALKKHMVAHKKNKFHCDTCKRPFARKDRLQEHMRSHTGEYLFECKVCGKIFNRRYTVFDHFFAHEFFEFRCNMCNTLYQDKDDFIAHTDLHIPRRKK